jgi:diphthine synthase
MLHIIGLGLGDEKDISVRAIETAKKCDCYAELYTNKWFGSIEGLNTILGKNVKLLKRHDLEDRLDDFIRECKEKDVALFVPGDPLAATTHSAIILEARKKKIPVKIIHNASIFSAIGETGLHLYKFGRTATVPFSGKLQAVRDAITVNRKAGLHTLLLLDLDAEVKLYMSAPDALKMLIKGKALKQTDAVLAAAALGTEQGEVRWGTAKEMLTASLGTPAVLIVPGKLHFHEREYLEGL